MLRPKTEFPEPSAPWQGAQPPAKAELDESQPSGGDSKGDLYSLKSAGIASERAVRATHLSMRPGGIRALIPVLRRYHKPAAAVNTSTMAKTMRLRFTLGEPTTIPARSTLAF